MSDSYLKHVKDLDSASRDPFVLPHHHMSKFPLSPSPRAFGVIYGKRIALAQRNPTLLVRFEGTPVLAE